MPDDNIRIFPGSKDKQQADKLVEEMTAQELDLAAASGVVQAAAAMMVAEGAATGHAIRVLGALEAYCCIAHERQAADVIRKTLKILTEGIQNNV